MGETVTKVNVRGVLFDSVSLAQAVEIAAAWLSRREGPKVVHTPNSEIIQMCVDEGKLDLVNDADLVLPDGAGVILAAKILKTPLPNGKVAGVDFGMALMELAAKEGYRLFLLGGKPGIAQKASEKMRARFPSLVICGVCDGYGDLADAAEKIRLSDADLVFVCLGAGRQEAWIRDYKKESGAILYCGLGGSLDVYAGAVRRAPKIMVFLWMEWLYRLCRQPSRFRRMKNIPRFLRGVRRDARAARKGAKC